MNLKEEWDLCNDGNLLSNKEKLLKIGEFLGVESKTCNEIPNKGWNIADREMEGRKPMRAKNIFKAFSEKIAYLICPDKPKFHEHNYVQGTKVYHQFKENLTNNTSLGREKPPVTAASISSKHFQKNRLPHLSW